MCLLAAKRWRYRTRIMGTTLRSCWDAPLPGRRDNWRAVPFLVCDAEMSSLDVAQGELLSLAWVGVDAGAIALDSARHYLLKATHSVGQSATVHQLRDCELQEGLAESEVMAQFLAAAAGRILVFHHATLDMAYLNRCSEREYGAPLLLPTVDTLALERARLEQRDVAITPGALRLQACRERYSLPAYPGHNALVDALATAELLIAQAQHRGGESLLLADFF